MHKEASPSSRVVELDALRGIAALAVVAFHYTTQYGQQYGHTTPLGFGFPPGNYGVNLFFLISGFVIFMTLERTRTTMDFVVSRFSHPYPAYWAAIAPHLHFRLRVPSLPACLLTLANTLSFVVERPAMRKIRSWWRAGGPQLKSA